MGNDKQRGKLECLCYNWKEQLFDSQQIVALKNVDTVVWDILSPSPNPRQENPL